MRSKMNAAFLEEDDRAHAGLAAPVAKTAGTPDEKPNKDAG